MFKTNTKYSQLSIFDANQKLTKKQQKLWSSSIEHKFFEQIFLKIHEEDFKQLYSETKSRPNVPVNQLVGSLILKHLFDWTYDELFKNLHFNSLTRHAIGINDPMKDVFSEASIFNFQNKIIEHYASTGIDLLTQVFDTLVADQLKEFKINTDIQRGDSFLIGSNIFDYTRLQLLIEVLLRFDRILSESDKLKHRTLLEPYRRQSSGQYIYKIKKEDLPHELNKLAVLYNQIYQTYKNEYADSKVFEIFKRVFVEHFTMIEDKIEVISSNQLGSHILMSPDDTDATYRDKRKSGCKGYSGHISETSNPINSINLITDVTVVPNNVDDAKILETQLPKMIKITPELNEYHADGLYGSPGVDKLMIPNIKLIQNSIRGQQPLVKKYIWENAEGEYWGGCENGQKVKACKATKGNHAKNWKVVFDYNICKECKLLNKCKLRTSGGKTTPKKKVWYFGEKKILFHKRLKNIEKIPQSRRCNRSNVEATVKELKRGMKNEKVRVRTLIKTRFYLTLTAIAVNLTRVHKHILAKILIRLLENMKNWTFKAHWEIKSVQLS